MKQDCKTIVFAKAPVPGFAKTRLIPALGAEAAGRLASRMLSETVAQACAAQLGAVEICCAPDSSHTQFSSLQAQHQIDLSAQGEGDLGQRMWRAFERGLEQFHRVIIIGTDAPALHAEHLRIAALALREKDAVFAPAFDGGYVLVGLSRPLPSLFEKIQWSTATVMQESRAQLLRVGASSFELAPFQDIDEPADLAFVPPNWLVSEL